MTNSDQANIILREAWKLKRNDDASIRRFLALVEQALENTGQRALNGLVFNEEEAARLKENYNWVCDRLAQLEKQ